MCPFEKDTRGTVWNETLVNKTRRYDCVAPLKGTVA